MRQRVTKEQEAALKPIAGKLVAERFQRLSALTESELRKVEGKTEKMLVEGVELRCETFHAEEAPGQHSFGVVVVADTFRAGPAASYLLLAKEGFWLKDGDRVPFDEDDWMEHHF